MLKRDLSSDFWIKAEQQDAILHTWQEQRLGDFNFLLEMSFDSPLDPALLESAVARLLQAEPLLTAVLVTRGNKPYWQSSDLPASSARLLITSDELEYRRIRETANGADEQFKVTLFQGGGDSRLLIHLSHAVADAHGIKEVAMMLARLYSDRLAINPASNQAIGRRELGQFLSWRMLSSSRRIIGEIRSLLALRKYSPDRIEISPSSQFCVVQRTIASDHLARLRELAHSKGATMNDLLLTAIFRTRPALARASSAWPLFLTFDMRRWHFSKSEAAVLGNLSSPQMLTLKAEEEAGFEATLADVARTTARLKAAHPGLAMLLYLMTCGKRMRAHATSLLMHSLRPGIPWIVANAGRLHAADLDFRGARPTAVSILPPGALYPAQMLSVSEFEGQLTLSFRTPPSNVANLEAWLDTFFRELPCEGVSTTGDTVVATTS